MQGVWLLEYLRKGVSILTNAHKEGLGILGFQGRNGTGSAWRIADLRPCLCPCCMALGKSQQLRQPLSPSVPAGIQPLGQAGCEYSPPLKKSHDNCSLNSS